MKLSKVTAREYEIWELVCYGLCKQKISNMLFVSYTTIGSHLNNLYVKLQVHNVHQLAVLGFKYGVVTQEDLREFQGDLVKAGAA
jgi:DNA-binding CsgD family transcriptional regulator